MKENLVFGADITAYGAKGDGKSDNSAAFQSAFDGGENLIVVPYGTYVIKKPLKLGSNVKLDVHPRAILLFDCEEKVLITNKEHKKGNSGIIINGGIWKVKSARKDKASDVFFGFELVKSLKITNVTVLPCHRNALCLKEVENFRIEGCVFDASDCTYASDGIKLCGCNNGVVRNLRYDGSEKQDRAMAFIAFSDGDSEVTEKLLIENINASRVYGFLRFATDKSKISDIEICDISGTFLHSVMDCVSGKLCDVTLENVSAICDKSSEDGGYFLLGSTDGLEIQKFCRDRESEAFPFIPTLRLKPSVGATLIVDGLALDEIITAKSKSKISDMTAAKIATSTGKFTYTIECNLGADDNLIIPTGNFDFLRADINE